MASEYTPPVGTEQAMSSVPHLVRTHEPSIMQQILLVTDGTLTTILETYIREKLTIVKLSEDSIMMPHGIDSLDLEAEEEAIERKILLQGQRSKKNWLYAESILIPGRLHEGFREQLLNSKKSIGKLWLEYKLETFKEIMSSTHQPAGGVAAYFDIRPTDGMLSRTYRVYSNRVPVMMITEKFPDTYFLDDV